MKRKMILLAFLLMLFIVPSVFIPSAAATYGDESPQSITSFSETLPDDTLWKIDNESYGTYSESFADVSDWSADAGFAGTITTNGDVATITETTDTYCRMSYIFGSPQNYDGLYLEYRITASATAQYRVNLYGGSNWFYVNAYSSALGTFKGIIIDSMGETGFDASDIDKITITVLGNAGTLGIDYLRISPANEMGWQHDFSETSDITSTSGDTFASDGNILTLTSDNVGKASYNITIDSTATNAMLRTSYYPFLAINCTGVSEGDGWRLEQFDGTAWAIVTPTPYSYSYILVSGLYRYNIATLDTYVQKFRINTTETATITFDFIKVYSIANYTVTQANCEIDDYLYCSSEILISNGIVGSNEYIRCDYDPALSIDASTYNIFNITTNQDNKGFYFVWKNPGTNVETETSGNCFGTITDFYLQVDSKDGDVGTRTFSAIKFIDNHDWNDAGEVTIYFLVPFDYWALDMMLIFAGLGMMILSSLYAAYKIGNDPDKTTLIIVLVLFMFGCALFFGGIGFIGGD